MSQAKVDRYKKEKKNREKELKKKRAKKYVVVVVLALLVGAGVGYPLGRKLYKVNAERRAANETISTSFYYSYLENYWDSKYTGTLGFPEPESNSETDEESEDLSDESVNDSETSDDIDSDATASDATE